MESDLGRLGRQLLAAVARSAGRWLVGEKIKSGDEHCCRCCYIVLLGHARVLVSLYSFPSTLITIDHKVPVLGRLPFARCYTGAAVYKRTVLYCTSVLLKVYRNNAVALLSSSTRGILRYTRVTILLQQYAKAAYDCGQRLQYSYG